LRGGNRGIKLGARQVDTPDRDSDRAPLDLEVRTELFNLSKQLPEPEMDRIA
jgi:hypothetical protein